MEKIPKKVKCIRALTDYYTVGEVYKVAGDGYVIDNLGDSYMTKWDQGKGLDDNLSSSFEPIWEEDFVLPEKWSISRDLLKEQNKIVTKWINDKWGSSFISKKFKGSYYKIDLKENTYGYGDYRDGFTEITFDQFKKYVIKESVEEKPKEYLTKDDLVEGEYYKQVGSYAFVFISNGSGTDQWRTGCYGNEKLFFSGGSTIGEPATYKKATQEQREHLDQCIAAGKYVDYKEEIESWCVEVTEENRDVVVKYIDNYRKEYTTGYFYGINKAGNKGCSINPFGKVLTTEQFYEKIGHVPEKKVEKWSVGTYVVSCISCAIGIPNFDKGCIAEIVDETKITYNEGYWSYSTKQERIGSVKWFATKEEAEEFRRQLLGKPEEEDSVAKYKVGDVVNTITGGKMTYYPELADVEDYIDSKPFPKERIVESKYIGKAKSWFYKFFWGSWYSECALEPTNTVVKEEEKPTDACEYWECERDLSSVENRHTTEKQEQYLKTVKATMVKVEPLF